MIVAFDYHGSLAAWPQLRDLAGALSRESSVHVISAISADDPREAEYRAAAEALPGVHAVHFVHFVGAPTPEVAYAVGRLKVGVMRQIGATVLFDDNPHVCRAVRDAGLMPCQLLPPRG